MRKKSNHGCQQMGALGNSGLAMPHLPDGLVGGWLMEALEDLSLPFFWAGIQASFLHLALTDGGRALFGLQGGLPVTSVLVASAQAATDVPWQPLGHVQGHAGCKAQLTRGALARNPLQAASW